MDKRLVDGVGQLKSYTDFSESILSAPQSEAETAISEFFRSVVETHPIVTFVSFGTLNGEYVEYPPFSPSASYDPRLRGWYRDALIHGGIRVSEPYETSVTHQLVISIDKVVTRENLVVGVVSLTIGLDTMMRYVNSLELSDGSTIHIFSPSGKTLLAPGRPEWLMKPASELGTDVFAHLGSHQDSSYEAVLDGETKIVTVYSSPVSGWKFVSLTTRKDIMARSRALSGVLLGVFLALALVVSLVLFWISGRIARPVLGLSRIIKRLSRFDFTEADRREMQRFQHGHDEISEMARELATMQKSYIELRNSLAVMDEQIQDIRVEDRDITPLSCPSAIRSPASPLRQRPARKGV
jgi:methyl-accepting chemotaxis protein